MTHKTGDRIKVWTPMSKREPAELRHGIVKNADTSSGRIYWYCDPQASIPCGMCGPGTGEGGHRLGMNRSRLID